MVTFKDKLIIKGNILELSHRDTCGGTENWKRTYEYSTNKPNNYLQKAYTGSTPPSSPQFTYDAHGNLLEMPHLNAMTWDFEDQLKTTEKTDETTYYVYTGGERVRKVCYNTATNKIKHERIYLGGYEIYREYDASGDLELERSSNHVMDSLSRQSGNRNRIAILEVKTMDNGTAITPGNQVTVARYQYSNHLGSASIELNEAAEIISYQEYHPFGSTSYELHINDSEVSLKRYQYVGKERDGESGLYYYGARYYADWLCRFVSVDPLKDDYPYYTTYQYAGNKPVSYIDLDGLEELNIEEPVSTRVNLNIIPEEFINLKPYSSYHENTGQLKETVKIFLEYSLSLEKAGLDMTTWTPSSKFSGSFWQNISVKEALKSSDAFGAITLNNSVVFLDKYLDGGKNDIDWLRLIAHEQIHVQQYMDLGLVGFGLKYLFETQHWGYRDAPLENFAYRLDNAIYEFLSENLFLIELLKGDWESLTENEKSSIIKMGEKFRIEKGIDVEISFWADWASEIAELIDDLSSNLPTGTTPNPTIVQLENTLSLFREHITDLHHQKETLTNQQ